MMDATPLRLRLSRRPGARLPAGAVKVDRSTIWGNPYQAGRDGDGDPAYLVRLHAAMLARDPAIEGEVRARLAGKSLACWCRLCFAHAAGKPFSVDCPDCAPCHADTLGRIANAGIICEPCHADPR